MDLKLKDRIVKQVLFRVGTYGKEEDEYGWCTLYAYMKCNNVGKK
jgi:hypothetical protein